MEEDFNVTTKAEEFALIKRMEAEAGAPQKACPVTNSAFNEIKDHQSQKVDGRGGGVPNEEKADE